jgi:hypothetical protein
VLELLNDFAALWKQFSPEQHKGLLQVMFAGAYFEGKRLIKVTANAPFDELLNLPKDGMMASVE